MTSTTPMPLLSFPAPENFSAINLRIVNAVLKIIWQNPPLFSRSFAVLFILG
jgi:hypothetical protein